MRLKISGPPTRTEITAAFKDDVGVPIIAGEEKLMFVPQASGRLNKKQIYYRGFSYAPPLKNKKEAALVLTVKKNKVIACWYETPEE